MDKSLARDSIPSDSHLLRLSCRFIPYDQWLTTHVDPSWKVKQVKLWLLGKFLGVSLHNQNQANVDTNKNVSHSQSMSLGHRGGSSMMPASPVPRYRPASPITFAPDPRTRPISPILFAKSSSKGKEKKRRGEASKTPRDVGDSGDMYGDNEYGIGTGDNGGGYEEDDEWDTADEGTNEFGNEPSGGSTIYPKRPQINTSSSRKTPLSASTLQTPSINTGLPSPSTSKYNTASSTYTLVRFSTGQKLEDEYQLSWYDLASHEILELHAHAPVQHLPASFGFPSPDLNAKSEHARSRRHARTESSSSLSHQISRTHAQAPSTECDTAHTLSSHTYFPVLDRTTPSSYVQPYWEGYVRALRVVWREESALTAHHVYGGRSGGIGEGATGGFVPAFAVMGYDPSGRDFRAFETREGGISAYAAEFAGSSVGRGKGKSRSRSTRLEWRLRWAIVRDGMLYLSKDREDKAPAQAYPLSALTALRGADHLATSSYFSQYQKSHKANSKHTQHQARNESGFPHNLPHRRASSSVRGHRNAASMDSYYTNSRDYVSDLDSDSDGDNRIPGVRMSELESDDLKIICIKFKAGGKVRGPFVPPTTTEPRNPKKYSSTIGYGALLASSGENGSEGGVDGYGFGTTAYVTVGTGNSSTSQWLNGGDKGKGKKGKDKEKRGPYLRKTSLPSLGIAEGSRTLVNLLGREKDKEGAKLTKGSPRGKERDKEKERNKDWIYAIAGVGPKPSREKDKSFGMQLAIPGIKKKAKQVDKGKAKDIPYASPQAASSGFNHLEDFVDEQEYIIEDPEAELEENAVACDGSDGESDEEDNAGGDTDADTEKDLDEDTEPGVRSDSPYPELPPPPTTQITPRAHPLQTAVVNLGSDSEESLALSSPVFRRNTISEAEDNSDNESGGKKGSAYRYGYRFPNSGVDNETGKGVSARSRKVSDVKEQVLRNKNSQSKLKNEINLKVDDEHHQGGDEAHLGAEKDKAKEKAEWIVLDMGTDLAFSSLLRVLHRQFPAPISSSFVSALPKFCAPTPASTPTPTPTPFPSPVSPRPAKPTSGPFAWSVSPAPSDGEIEDTPCDRVTGEPVRSVSQQSSIPLLTTQHPPVLAALSNQAAFSMQKTFGALPYPEWRMELVEKAQRAGMGDVGSALRWVMWQSDRQLERDLEDARSLKDEGASGVSLRKRRGTIGSRSSRRCRRGAASTAGSSGDPEVDTPALSDSDRSEETGKLIVISDSEGESSEAEWHGWMADLFRQQRVRAHAQRAKEEVEDDATHKLLVEGEHPNEPPRTPADDRRRVLEKRKALEPVGIVSTSSFTPSSSTARSTPSATLHSFSSSESLAVQRTRTLSFSPEVASGPSSSHGHGQSVSRPMSPLANPEFQRQPGTSLSHSASMYTGLRSSTVAEQSLRRPSMPTLATEQTISISSSHQSSIARTPGSSSIYTFPQNQAAHSQSPSQFNSPFTGEVVSPSSTETTKAASSNSSAVRGRTSSTGLGSLGRSASIFGRSNGALRKDTDKAREREEKRTMERDESYGDQDKAKEGRATAQRPKLSVATPSLQHTVPQPELLSPQPVRKHKPSILRHVRSGSSLKSSEEVEPASPTVGGFGKKKKGVFVDRFVRGLG